MISLQLYILILLAISAVSLYFISGVLIKQIRLLKAPFEEAEKYDEATRKLLRRFRKVLFVISLTIIIMGLIPILINVYTLFFITNRPSTIQPLSLIYSLGVHLQGLFLSYLVSRLYQLASNQKEVTDFELHQLKDELREQKSK